MDYLSAFILGISSGLACISVCLPGILPILMGRRTSVRQSAVFVAAFLTGRWCAYVMAAAITSVFATAVSDISSNKTILTATQLALAAIMLLFAAGKLSSRCVNPLKHKRFRAFLMRGGCLLPVAMGFLTSVALCPPFVTMVVQTAGEESVWRAIALFTMFFVGTLPYFVPVPFIGLSGRSAATKSIGRYAAVIMGFVYLYNAIKLIIS